jgi:hypothetical protein
MVGEANKSSSQGHTACCVGSCCSWQVTAPSHPHSVRRRRQPCKSPNRSINRGGEKTSRNTWPNDDDGGVWRRTLEGHQVNGSRRRKRRRRPTDRLLANR